MRPASQRSRFLGLWTAAWLFVLLLGLTVWLGDLSLQWPVLLVPVAWALVALRPGPGRARRPVDEDEFWPAEDDVPPEPRLPPTRELPWLPQVPQDRREE